MSLPLHLATAIVSALEAGAFPTSWRLHDPQAGAAEPVLSLAR